MTSPLPKMTFTLMLLIFMNLAGMALANPQSDRIDMKIEITIRPGVPKVEGVATTRFSGLLSGKVKSGASKITSIKAQDGKAIRFKIEKGTILPLSKKVSPDQEISIGFETVVGKRPSFKSQFGSSDFISSSYVLLTGAWSPLLSDLSTYRLTLKIDKNFVPVSEADTTLETESEGIKKVTFIFNKPRRSITVMAARFHRYEQESQGVTLRVYLLEERKQLASQILKVLEKGLTSYNKLLSPYPFGQFNVVETPLPIGVTVPTLTLIGTQIIDKPFVLNVSLMHEFVHSWFGNSVFVASTSGNWCEGLTTYMADYLSQEKAGKGLEYRHNILADYKSYVHPTNAFPLSEFRFRYDRTSKAIGYGKCAMVFHMLRQMVGDETFFKTLASFTEKYRFKEASWKDIERLFSEAAKRDLEKFFNEWLSRKDVVRIRIETATEEKLDDKNFRVKVVLIQETKRLYSVNVPIQVLTSTTVKTSLIPVKDFRTEAEITVSGWPRLVILDPQFNIMRDLSLEEFPPSLARLFGAEKRFLILPEKEEKPLYSPIISFLKGKGFQVMEREKLKHEMLKEGSFLVLGTTKGRLETFAGKLTPPKEGVLIKVKDNPLNPEQVSAALVTSSASELQGVVHKLPHYGEYTTLLFRNGKIEKKEVADYEKGVAAGVTPEVSGIFSRKIDFMDGIVNGLEKYQVIYLGEKHDEEGIHQAQLKIIEAISQKAPLAVGMEMFQRPFQGVIDKYLAGNISEREFLKGTEYFKRWAFNYHFYRPIVEFCKNNHIPLVALNLPAEISKKIARKGFSALSKKERKELPAELDLSNELYKRYLRQIYSAHEQEGDLDNFDNFFEAQIAWDETMAQSIADYLEKYPERKMVIIVGGGHVEYGYGIPSRVKRRLPHLSQAIALFNQRAPLDPSKADLFLYAPRMEEPFLPKLGVMLVGQNKLTVEAVVPGSPAAKAGLKKGDVITALDGRPVKDIYELKLELFFKKKGEKVKISVRRKDNKGAIKTVELVSGELVPVDWSKMKMGFHMSK